MDDYIAFEMNHVDGGNGGSGGSSGCLSFILACLLVFGGIVLVISILQ